MTCDITSDDLEWCRRAARSLAKGDDYIEAEPDRPFVNRRTTSFQPGGRLEDAVGGEISWGAEGFQISLPLSGAVNVELRRTDGRQAFERLLASALLHELVHFRQFRNIAHAADSPPAKLTDIEPATLLRSYYLDPRELEAHAAQIAFLLGTCDDDGKTTEDDVFARTEVGGRIGRRLDVLANEPLGDEYALFRTSLTALAGEWRQRLWSSEGAEPVD